MPSGEAQHNLQKTVDEITGYRRRTRKLVSGLIAVTAISLALAVITGYLYVRLHDSDVSSCQLSNTTRAQQEQLWFDVLSLAVGPHPTAQGRAFRQQTTTDVEKTYAPVNCSARYPFW